MNAESIIQAAENDGLRLALTDVGTVKCIGPKQMTERWAPQLRQHKAAIVAALTAANDDDPSMDEAAEFWRTFLKRVTECDKLINSLCDLRGADDDHRADLLAVRKRMAPQKLDGDIAYLKAEIAALTPAPPPAQTTGRCIDCASFAPAGLGHRCSHPDRSSPTDPPRADCLPDHQCDRFIFWKQS